MRALLPGLLLWLCAAPGFAQEGRFTVGVNGGYQAASNNFRDRYTFEANKEPARTETQYPVRGDVTFDAGGSMRIWKRLGAGVTVSRYTRKAAAHTVSQVPHPLYLGQPREVTGDAAGITRTETGTHVQVLFLVPTAGRLQFSFSGGPSFISVEQDLVTAVRYQETYPFDDITFTGADTQKARRSAAGYNAGADAVWMFNRTFGVGGAVRFTRARVNLPATGRTVGVDAGGAQAGIGIRVHF
jgi:hypothetical protein